MGSHAVITSVQGWVLSFFSSALIMTLSRSAKSDEKGVRAMIIVSGVFLLLFAFWLVFLVALIAFLAIV